MKTRVDRRTFFKVSAAVSTAAWLKAPAPSASRETRPLIAATIPLPFPHHYWPSAEALMRQRLEDFDLLLIPAYAAVELITRGVLASCPGPGGHAYDPDGAYTRPYGIAAAAIISRRQTPKLTDLWRTDAVWPDAPRLTIGAALLRHGRPLNDTNPAHLAQAEAELIRLRPRFSAKPTAELQRGRANTILSLQPLGAMASRQNVIPVALIELVWAIPCPAPNRRAVLAFLDSEAAPCSPPVEVTEPHHTLAPLPPRAAARYAAIWQRIQQAIHLPCPIS